MKTLKRTLTFQGDVYYDAYERDIAMVTIFFGDSTVFGKFSVAETIFLITVSVGFVLDSVLFPLLRLSTGFLSSFAGTSKLEECEVEIKIHSPLMLM